MRSAEAVLHVIREKGKRDLPLGNDLYRQLYNPSLYLLAYNRIARNAGAMTQGVSEETVDGMSLSKIKHIIELLRDEWYRWTPVRRVMIPKKNGKMRPLGIPSWSDKLLQEVIRMILEAYYEPQFSKASHGFRPNRGCHTALHTIEKRWCGTKWFIEGDIRGCFDNIEHGTLMSILRERIQDNRFLRLLANLFEAGYLEQWTYRPTLSGVPQGGIVSPILSNIYLDRLDKFVERVLIPANTRGEIRQENAEYAKLVKRKYYLRKKGRLEEARETEKQFQRIPSKDEHDPNFRRLYYVRYADDWLIGFIGPMSEAEAIKEQLRTFLCDELKLELSPEKTLVTHARTHAAKFLGYEIVVTYDNAKHTNGRRSINGNVGLRVPAKFIQDKCADFMRDGKSFHRPELVNESDFSIVQEYQAKYRGYVQYYKLAHNLSWLAQLLWVMQSSLLKTLACKHKSSMNAIARKYKATARFEHGLRKCIEVTVTRVDKPPLVARFGGLSLTRDRYATIVDMPNLNRRPPHSELLQRLLAEKCELCGSTEDVEVHHIRALKNLKVLGKKERPLWQQVMAARHRKTLVVCRSCHAAIHQGEIPKAHGTR